jgi:hypothetical protein
MDFILITMELLALALQG